MLSIVPYNLRLIAGSSINERQLLESLSKKIDRIIVFSLAPITTIKNKKYKLPSNITLINLPYLKNFGIPIMFLYSFILLLVGYFLNQIYNFRMIYIRDTKLAFAFMLSKELRQKSIVKIPSIFEDEAIISPFTKRILKKIFYFIDHFVLSVCGKIAIPSPLWIDKLMKKRNISRKNSDYIVVPAGVNLSRIKNIWVKRNIKFKLNEFNIGFIGKLFWWQGVETLIQAIYLLKRKAPDLKLNLIIIGDGPLRFKIEEMCKVLNISYKITGFLPHEEALKHLAMLDIMVLPSKRISTTELNIPIKIIEAWALGIPIVATKHRVFIEMSFKDGEHLVYCEPNPRDVAKAILRLINDEELRRKLSKIGPKLARKFNYDKIADALISALKI